MTTSFNTQGDCCFLCVCGECIPQFGCLLILPLNAECPAKTLMGFRVQWIGIRLRKGKFLYDKQILLRLPSQIKNSLLHDYIVYWPSTQIRPISKNVPIIVDSSLRNTVRMNYLNKEYIVVLVTWSLSHWNTLYKINVQFSCGSLVFSSYVFNLDVWFLKLWLLFWDTGRWAWQLTSHRCLANTKKLHTRKQQYR